MTGISSLPSHDDAIIAVVGLGYVGLPLAVEFGKRRKVIGFDIDQTRIAELRSGTDHTLESSPEELAEARQLSFTANPADMAQVNGARLLVLGRGLQRELPEPAQHQGSRRRFRAQKLWHRRGYP